MVRGLKKKVKAGTSKEQKDVVMGTSTKVKKKISKSKRRKANANAASAKLAGKAVQESRKVRRRRIVAATLASRASLGVTEPPEQLRARQAQEWKDMKAKVASLKKDKKKLPTTGGKMQRQAVTQSIRKLVEEMQLRHVAELHAAGLDVTSQGTSKSKTLMTDTMADE